MEMTPRKEKILSSVVRDFVKSGEPVGSKAIADEIGVSSATVRNEMAELIDMGLLEQPHTSAGRIPSQRGYREYIDRLDTLPDIKDEEKKYFDSLMAANSYEPERLLTAVCQAVAGSERYAAAATVPGGDAARVRAVQLVQTGRRTAMLLLMSSAGTIKSRLFRCDFDLTHDMLRVFFRAFNEKVTGRRVAEITPGFLQTVAASLGDMYILAAPALQALYDASRETTDADVIKAGQMNLLFYPELEHRRIMDLLERKDALLPLLRGRSGKVSAVIDRESGREELRNAAIVVSRYRVGDQDAGVLAVLGPARMDYPRIMSLLQYLSGQVGRLLTVSMHEE